MPGREGEGVRERGREGERERGREGERERERERGRERGREGEEEAMPVAALAATWEVLDAWGGRCIICD